MSIFKNKPVNTLDLYSDNILISSSIYNAHSSVVNAFDNMNLLYGESSVSEDIALNSFLSIYSIAKSVTDKNIKNIVNESFLSQDSIDPDFPVDKMLNMDIQNGDLTLPILSTSDIEISNIIIESDSNGYPSEIEDNNIESILTRNSSALFQYEKISNALSISDLYLSLTLKTKEVDIINGIYIRLFADETDYPKIAFVENSVDGSIWSKVDFTTDINKADFFIRFDPQKVRYTRIRFFQSSYKGVETGFGVRYKYLIGIREISLKKTIYDNYGEYMSVPYTGRSVISSLTFGCKDDGNVKYFISANNGTKLVEVNNNQTLVIYNKEMGVREDKDIDSVRVKIVMDKINTSISKIRDREYFPLNPNGSYYLKNIPLESKAYIGKHISYGEMTQYIVNMNSLVNADDTIFDIGEEVKSTVNLFYIPYYDGIVSDLTLRLNNIKIKNDRAIYDITTHESPRHSTLLIKNDILLSNNGSLSITYNSIASSGQNIILPCKSFFPTKDGFIITKSSGEQTITLKNTEFEIVDEDKTIIKILDKAYSDDSIYSISFYPSVNITDDLPESTVSNEIQMKSLIHIPSTQICFDYTYNNQSDSDKIKYYTPICHEYQLELK